MQKKARPTKTALCSCPACKAAIAAATANARAKAARAKAMAVERARQRRQEQQIRRDAATEQARFKRLLKLCTPTPVGTRCVFNMYGMLPHGQPLFGDASTLCAGCKRAMNYERLTKGRCRACIKAKVKATPYGDKHEVTQ